MIANRMQTDAGRKRINSYNILTDSSLIKLKTIKLAIHKIKSGFMDGGEDYFEVLAD